LWCADAALTSKTARRAMEALMSLSAMRMLLVGEAKTVKKAFGTRTQITT